MAGLLLVGCVAPNQKDFIKGNIDATALAQYNWQYTFFRVGTEKQPIGKECPIQFAIGDRAFALTGLTPIDVVSLGGKPSGDFSPGWPKDAKPYMIENNHFVFLQNRLLIVDFDFYPYTNRPASSVRIGRVGLDKWFSIPMQEGDLVELLGPADKIRLFGNW